jgi:hypothetical protein
MEIWEDSSTTQHERESLIGRIPESAARDHLALYSIALTDPAFSGGCRYKAILILGRIGDESVLPTLAQFAANETEQELQDLAQGASEAIQARVAAADPNQEIIYPEGGTPSETSIVN